MNKEKEKKDRYLKYKKSLNIDKYSYAPKNFLVSLLKLSAITKNLIKFNNFKKIKYLYHTGYNINICNIFYFDIVYLEIGPSAISADGEYKYMLVNLDIAIESYKNVDKVNIKIAEKFLKDHKKYLYTNIEYELLVIIIQYKLQIMLTLILNVYPLNYNKLYLTLFEPYIKNIVRDNNDNKFLALVKKNYAVRMGFKIIPLSINDIKNLGEITQSFEREIYLNEKITELVYNGICSNFPILIRWFIFPTTDKYIYSNETIHKKYKNSIDYMNKLRFLYKAKVIEDIDVEIVDSYKRKLEVPINFMEKNIILSDYSVGIVSTYVGNTLSYLITKSLDLKEPSIINNKNIFKHFLFDIIYTLYILNDKIGIIHGDLHLNNITFFRTVNLVNNFLYIVNGKEYFLNDKKYIFYIIDYGRSFISPSILRIDFKKNDNIIYIQNKKLLDYFNKVMPEFYMENKFNLDKAMQYNMDTIYKVLTGLDIIYLLSNLRVNINKAMSHDIIEFISSIEEFAKDYLRNNIYSLLNSTKIDEENINKKILYKFFESEKNLNNITSCNNSDNEIIYKYNKEDELLNVTGFKTGKTPKDLYKKEIKDIKKKEIENFKKEGIYN